MNTNLQLNFVTLNKEPLFKYFEVLNEKKQLQFKTLETIKIPDDFFDGDYNKMIRVKVLSEEIDSIIEFKLNKNVDNYCTIFCDDIGKTYHLLFNQEKNKEEKIDILIPSYKFHLDKYDTNGTKYRKRFVLANTSFSYIKINGVGINLSDLTKGIGINSSSYQLSVYNLNKRYIVAKCLEMTKKRISFESIYEDNYQIFDNFIQDFNKGLNNEKDFEENFSQLFIKYKDIIFPDYFLNISKNKIEKELNKQEYIEFFYNMMIFRIYNKHIKGAKKSYKTVKSFIAYLKEKIDRIKNDADLKLYQKILLIEQFSHILDKMTQDSFLKSDINYFNMSKKEENSILYFVEKFFFDYINNLSEDSQIFFKLLELDSDIGYLNGKPFYCFDMTTIDEIKSHLKEIFIDTLITYKANKRISSFIISKNGAVAINLSEIPGYEKFFLEKKLEKYELTQGKDVAAKIVVFLLHEICGHKKFLYEKKKFIYSPCHFIQNGKIYFLDYKNSVSKEPNSIKILHNRNTYSDDGTYYELSYGKIGDYYAIEIIDEMNGYGDLLDEINLWTNDLESLNEYFKYKYIIQCKNISLNTCPSNIKEKITFFKEQVLKSGIDVESFYKNETMIENNLLGKKTKRPKNIYSNDDKDSYNKIGTNTTGNEDEEEAENNEEENPLFNFDEMSYEELADLYYNGKLKGDNLTECYKRISDYEILS